jgi:hypothetical protein
LAEAEQGHKNVVELVASSVPRRKDDTDSSGVVGDVGGMGDTGGGGD